MKGLEGLTRKTSAFLKKNGATILTGAATVGVVATAVTTGKATIKATQVVNAAEQIKGEELTPKEKLKIAAPIYIPAVLFGAATITCLIGSNVLNKQKQASLIGAYTLLDSSFKEYKNKVKEMYGEDANTQIAESFAKENPIEKEDDEKELFYDLFSKRYFESTKVDVLQAEYDLNKLLITGCCAGLNEFYEMVGLTPIAEYSDLGWAIGLMEDTYWHPWIEFDHIPTELEDGLECTIIDFPLAPMADYLEW